MNPKSPNPTTELCLLFTDIEGSTNLLQSHGDTYAEILSRHYELLRNAIQVCDGEEVRTIGDSVFAVFPESRLGVQAAIDAQIALHEEHWVHGGNLKVRMGLHNGVVQRYADEFVGIEVHRAARIGSVGKGGQIVISSTVRDDIKGERFHPDVRIRDLGFHQLKDLRYPESLFDLEIAGLPSEFDHLALVNASRTNLPSQKLVLYGRQKQIDSLKRRLSVDRERLISLCGTGGTGKTSLALSVGQELLSSFPRGVFLVQLGEVSSADLIAPAIAQALGIHQQAGMSALATLKQVIGDGELLLIMDTFEHVISGAEVVAALLEACPNLCFLVTSREPLHLKPETVVEVPPLTIPSSSASFSDIAGNASVQVFVDLAQREYADFQLTKENSKSVANICQRLDGLPLAIGLAASRVSLFEPSEIAERLQTRLLDLRNRSRDVDPRHRTLHAAIEWSDNLLTESERRTFCGLSVFAGGFDTEAAGFILADNAAKDEVSRNLESLISKHLLTKTTALGRPRLSMLDTIRDYAAEALEQTASRAPCAARHAAYYSKVAATAAPNILRENQRDFVEFLFLEIGNIRAALEWLVTQPSAHGTAELVSSLKWFWISRGLFSEAQSWTDLALAQATRLSDSAALAAIADVSSWVRFMSGDAEGALKPACDSYDLYRELGDRPGQASAGIMAGLAKAVAGQIPEGPNHILESLELCRDLGDQHGASIALIALGEGLRGEGDEDEAEKCYQEALGMLDEITNTFWPGLLFQNIAHFRLHKGDWKAAAKLATDALSIGERYDYPMMVNLAVAAAAGVALARDDAVGSARIVGAVEARLQRLGATFEPTDYADLQRIKNGALEKLGEPAFAAALREGALMAWETTLAAARGCAPA